MNPTDPAQQYDALTREVGYVPLEDRTQIELVGEDRAAFLHNLSTNDIRKLAIGSGCEAFFCNAQGKAIAHAFVWAMPNSLVIDTIGGLAQKLMAHLDRYLIREKVELIDRSSQWSALLLSGAGSHALLATFGVALAAETGTLYHQSIKIAGQEVSVRRVPIIRPVCFLLSCAAEHVGNVAAALDAAGACHCSLEAVEPARIEAGFPWYGIDISEENLAPEVGRSEQAISYVKGCYLGQETIARIDALGHVNRLLVGVHIEQHQPPPTGTELTAEEKVVGKVTSAAYSPRLNSSLALAYVRRGYNEPGTPLTAGQVPARVVALPVD